MIKSKVQQNVKYDSETGKVYEELGSSGSGNSCNPPPPSTSARATIMSPASSPPPSTSKARSPYAQTKTHRCRQVT